MQQSTRRVADFQLSLGSVSFPLFAGLRSSGLPVTLLHCVVLPAADALTLNGNNEWLYADAAGCLNPNISPPGPNSSAAFGGGSSVRRRSFLPAIDEKIERKSGPGTEGGPDSNEAGSSSQKLEVALLCCSSSE